MSFSMSISDDCSFLQLPLIMTKFLCLLLVIIGHGASQEPDCQVLLSDSDLFPKVPTVVQLSQTSARVSWADLWSAVDQQSCLSNVKVIINNQEEQAVAIHDLTLQETVLNDLETCTDLTITGLIYF